MNTNIKIPIGLTAAVDAIEEICMKTPAYHRCGLKPPHYIINLDAGNGQSTLAEYMAESFADAGIRHFGGLDMYLEYTLDGTVEQLKKVFSDIRSCAVYTNEFEGVIAMDISKLATHINETQVDIFLSEVSKISRHATFIFYVPSATNRNMAILANKISTAIDEVKILTVYPYNTEEIVAIIKGMIEEAGVMLEEDGNVDKLLCEMVLAKDIISVKAAKKISQELVKNANFKAFIPKLTYTELENVCCLTIENKKEAK